MSTWINDILADTDEETRAEREWERDRLLLVGPYLAAELIRTLTPIQTEG